MTIALVNLLKGKSRQCVESSAESDDEEISRRLPSPPPVRKSPRKPQGREQSQIQLPPKKRAKTNELIAGYFFYAFLLLL